MILSEQTFIELAGKQEVLDAKIKQANNVTYLSLRQIELYYRVELGECINEMKGDFKHWSNKPMRRTEFIEELVDALHFFLSYTNHILTKQDEEEPDFDLNYFHRCEYASLKGNYTFFVEVLMEEEPQGVPNVEVAISSILDSHIRGSFAKLLYLAERYGYTEQDIIDTYNRKNSINHDRSDSGVY